MGRFLQTDPIGQDDDPNLYAYVGDDPVDRADPTGTQHLNLGADDAYAQAQIAKQNGNWSAAAWLEFNAGMRAYTTCLFNTMGDVGAVTSLGSGIGGRGVVMMAPTTLRFSQITAGGGGKFARVAQAMVDKGWAGPAIDAVQTDAGIVTFDNTRVIAARAAGIEKIPVNIHAPGDRLSAMTILEERFGKAKTWGEALIRRTSRQSKPLAPTGTRTPPRVPGFGAKQWDGTIYN